MPAPYVVCVSWNYSSEKKIATLPEAIAICQVQRERRRVAGLGCHDSEPRIYGGDIDLDCADGLTADERDQVREALG